MSIFAKAGENGSTSLPLRRYVWVWRLIQHVDFSDFFRLDCGPVAAAAKSIPANQAGLSATRQRAAVWRFVGRAVRLFEHPAVAAREPGTGELFRFERSPERFRRAGSGATVRQPDSGAERVFPIAERFPGRPSGGRRGRRLAVQGQDQYVPSASQGQNPVEQALQDYTQLASDLQSGNLTGAQSAYSNLQQLVQAQGSSTSSLGNTPTTVQTDFATLGQDLQAGNLTASQSAFAQLQSDLPGCHPKSRPAGPAGLRPAHKRSCIRQPYGRAVGIRGFDPGAPDPGGHGNRHRHHQFHQQQRPHRERSQCARPGAFLRQSDSGAERVLPTAERHPDAPQQSGSSQNQRPDQGQRAEGHHHHHHGGDGGSSTQSSTSTTSSSTNNYTSSNSSSTVSVYA